MQNNDNLIVLKSDNVKKIIKSFDTNGSVNWEKDFTTEYLASISKANGNQIICVATNGASKVILILLDDDGSVVWQKELPNLTINY